MTQDTNFNKKKGTAEKNNQIYFFRHHLIRNMLQAVSIYIYNGTAFRGFRTYYLV